MAKKGQHQNDATDSSKPRGHEQSWGRNHPDRTQTITTGTYKKPETYAAQARNNEDPGKTAQASPNPWNKDTRDKPTIEGSTRARDSSVSGGRNGSQSGTGGGTRSG